YIGCGKCGAAMTVSTPVAATPVAVGASTRSPVETTASNNLDRTAWGCVLSSTLCFTDPNEAMMNCGLGNEGRGGKTPARCLRAAERKKSGASARFCSNCVPGGVTGAPSGATKNTP